MEEKKKKRKWIPIAILIGIIFIIGILISTIFAFANINKNTIVSGVKIEGIDVSGLSAEEAKGKLETIYTEKLETEIPVQYKEYETTINANLFETKYNIEDAVKKAIEIGKEGNIFENNYKILFALIGKQDIKVEMQLNEEAAKKIIEDLGTNLPGVVIESSYYIEDNKLIITKKTIIKRKLFVGSDFQNFLMFGIMGSEGDKYGSGLYHDPLTVGYRYRGAEPIGVHDDREDCDR